MKTIGQKTAKVTKPQPKFPAASKTIVSEADAKLGTVKLFHHQGVKQSANYQSGDVAYAVEIYVPNDPRSIMEGIRRCEELVENALGDKLPQMQKVLIGLANANQGN